MGTYLGENYFLVVSRYLYYMNYRKLWESIHGTIPKDSSGRTFDIHHIDGNRKNNSIDNLICLSLEDHYKIHLKQFEEIKSEKEFRSLIFLSSRINKSVNELTGWTVSQETKYKISKTLTGTKRPEDVIKKFKEKLTGYKWTEEQINSRVEGLKNFYKENDRESRSEWRKNISESHKGKILSDETKLKLSKYNSKLTDNEVLEIVDLINSGKTYKFISEKYNISQSQITSIKQKKTYKWIWN
jgi:hypothetical protein